MGRKKTKHRVFVYGTLRTSKVATHTLAGFAMFAVSGKAFTFPFIQYMGDRLLDELEVVGQVIEVDDAELANMDKYEGVDRQLYERVKEIVYSIEEMESRQGSEGEEVWVYVAGPALVYPHVVSGDWFQR